MSATHTPGPWIMHRTPAGGVITGGAPATRFGIRTQCALIVSIPLPAGNDAQPDARMADNDEANARLIAAAPELLAALQAINAAAKRSIERGDGAVKAQWLGLQVCAAIAKATGQT